MADYMHFSLRLNRDIPEHKRIIKFLDEMDPGKYKSKTAFLASAISFYIACIEDGSLEKLEDRKFREHATDYVTRDEFNARFIRFHRKENLQGNHFSLYQNSDFGICHGAGKSKRCIRVWGR